MSFHYDPGMIAVTYVNQEQLIMNKLVAALEAAQCEQRESEEKVKTSTAILTAAVGRAAGLMKQNTDGFAQTDRILAEAIAAHERMTAYYNAEKEKYARDAADEQGTLKRILVAVEQEKAAADADIQYCRAAIEAHNADKEKRAAEERAAIAEERAATAEERAARRARELREHEAAARAQFIPAERARTGGGGARTQLATKASVTAHGARCGVQEGPARVTAHCAARPATRSTTRAIITEQTKQTLLIRQGGLCGKPSTGHGCGQQLPISRADGEPRPIYDIDHIMPISAVRWLYGGDPNNIDNLQALCPNCHAVKSRHTDRGRVVE
jgi:hypothetical protein